MFELDKEIKRPVIVAPTFVPMITEVAWNRVKAPALTKPTTITVTAVEDWITAVVPAPSPRPTKRLFVTLKYDFNLSGENFPSAEQNITMPDKKRPTEINNKITSIIFSMHMKKY